MNYKLLNNDQRKRMKRIINNEFEMEWEDPDFFNTLIGKLPSVHHTQNESEIQTELAALERLLSQYDAFSENREMLIKNIKNIVAHIQRKQANWYGLNVYEVEESIRQQECCLISGEGGIGKSYFIMCLEEEFEHRNISHLCLYGKFEKNINNIELNEIIEDSQNGFVFIVDAINEMSENGQENLLNILHSLRQYNNIRIILTYRTNAMDVAMLDQYKEIAKAEYTFPGVSFESALGELLKLSIPDIYKYEDILYSNNALLLSMLCSVLSDKKIIDETENGIATVTFMLEHYIKKSIKRIFKGKVSDEDPVKIWKDTKEVAKWMYRNERKEIDEDNLHLIVKTGGTFIQIMMQAGFLRDYDNNDVHYFYFAIDTLTDFLIARSLFEDIAERTFEEQVGIISKKVRKLYSMEEALIIAIFDNYAPDYKYIVRLLKATDLFADVQYETLIKINFKEEYIKDFIKAFQPTESGQLITIFGGYTNKPFNCTHYLNAYYKSGKNQLRELSTVLSGSYFLERVKGRLKNIIYFITLNYSDNRRIEEAFYFALWCCAAPNKDVRCLAMKLLYEIMRQNNVYKDRLIREYEENIIDPYIKESIIYILAVCLPNDVDIVFFFNKLIIQEKQLVAKSIKRISTYLKDKYGYIKWNRENLYDIHSGTDISDFLNDVLFRIDLMNKDFFNFRYWGKDHIDMHTRFLDIDKKEILKLNNFLEKKYICVKTGKCNGSMSFEDFALGEYNVNSDKQVLEIGTFFCSYEVVLRQIFDLFEESFNQADSYMREEDFTNSIFMKCVDIATGNYYGSLMCNYYTNEFATYNNWQENIGYEVYDPIEYGEDIYIATPVPTYQDFIERLGDMVLNRIEIPVEKDLIWVRDAAITRKNLLSLIEPIKIKSVEWVMIAGRISVHEDTKRETRWKDTYDIWCCTSEKETIMDDGKARYLTIELDEYSGNLDNYGKCTLKPWLCKDVKNINYLSSIFDDTSLVLPPATLISHFQLSPVYADMSWVDKNGKKVILCNNNKNSYYKDPIGGTVFIRKEYLDEYLNGHVLKYFAFTEKFIPETGYADETSLHFEIQEGKIIKEIFNNSERGERLVETNPLCTDCPYGLNEKEPYDNADINEWFELLMENGYLTTDSKNGN